MLNYPRKLWQRARAFLPLEGFFFDRPIVILQSDDWGRAGTPDEEGFDRLRSFGLAIGERPYDLYTLETADDLSALSGLLLRHRDSAGRAACMVMNFILANLDLAKMQIVDFRNICLLPLAQGLPGSWDRPGLLDAYRVGIEQSAFYPGLHGETHFYRNAIERGLKDGGERSSLLRTLWQAGTPYIHWRMPWIGYEYWDPEKAPDERFLSATEQQELIGHAVGTFSKLFSVLPRSASAPGYRANTNTHSAWADFGVRVAQNGPEISTVPHIDRYGLLHLYRSVEFEPAFDPSLSVESAIRQAEGCFSQGLPAVVSIHSINFHSSVSGFRDRTLGLLDQFLSALETRHQDLLYLHDDDLYHLIQTGSCETAAGRIQVNVIKKKFSRRRSTSIPPASKKAIE